MYSGQNHKKLYRSTDDRIIAGVAGGLAEYFETDATILRIIFVLLAFAGGSGIIIYLVLCIIVPERDSEKNMDPQNDNETSGGPHHDEMHPHGHHHDHHHDHDDHHHHHVGIGGFILIILGLILLLNNLFPDYSFDRYWPLILIFIGAAIMFRRRP